MNYFKHLRDASGTDQGHLRATSSPHNSDSNPDSKTINSLVRDDVALNRSIFEIYD